METKTGLITVVELKDEADPPRFEITCTMTRPTTSSIMAALVKTTPRRDLVRPLVDRTVKVVPRLVEHRAAPAEKAWRGVAPSSCWRTKERPMGTPIPVAATAIDSSRLAFKEEKEVDRPPGKRNDQHGTTIYINYIRENARTFEHQEDQA